jgi:hypothetical protein
VANSSQFRYKYDGWEGQQTFQAMHNDVQLALREQRFQLLGPDAFGIEGGEGFDLVFVGHCADDCRDIFDVGRCQMEGFELLDDGLDLGDGELGAAGADVDFGDGVGIGAGAAAGERCGGHFF